MAKENLIGAIVVTAILVGLPLGSYYYNEARAQEMQRLRIIEIDARSVERGNWNPSEIELVAHETYVIRMYATDVVHGFASTELGVESEVHPGHVKELKITPRKTGTFEFRCSVWCPRHAEMLGFIVVRDPDAEVLDDGGNELEVDDRLDILYAWFSYEDRDMMHVSMKVADLEFPDKIDASYHYAFHFEVPAPSGLRNLYQVHVKLSGDGTASYDINLWHSLGYTGEWQHLTKTTGTVDTENDIITVEVMKENIGKPSSGTKLEGTYATSYLADPSYVEEVLVDEAPDTGVGKPYQIRIAQLELEKITTVAAIMAAFAGLAILSFKKRKKMSRDEDISKER